MPPQSEVTLPADDVSSADSINEFVLSPDQINDLGIFQTILEFLYSVTDLIIRFFT